MLPDVALGSGVLFHLERTLAVMAACIALLVVIGRAWSGQLPSEFSAQGLKYAETEAAEGVLADVVEETERLRIEFEGLRRRVERIEGGG
jgi:hypothetical protein